MSKFKNSNGVYFLRELFYETCQNKDNAVYTLKNEDHKGYVSLYRLYMEANDPTEYSFAVSHLGGWDHWETLSNCSWMQDYVAAWRRELEIRARSQALATIIDKAQGSGREAFQAAKYVAEGWGNKNTRGRPTKAEVRQNALTILESKRTLDEDFERVSELMN